MTTKKKTKTTRVERSLRIRAPDGRRLIDRLETVLAEDRRHRLLNWQSAFDGARIADTEAMQSERCVVTALGLTPDEARDGGDLYLPPGPRPITDGCIANAEGVAVIRPQRPVLFTEIRVSDGWYITRLTRGADYLAMGPCEVARIKEVLTPGQELRVTVERR